MTVATLAVAGARPAAGAETRLGCDPIALQAAIADANAAGSGKIKLASNCIYSITTPATASDAFPIITGHIRIRGDRRSIVTRDPAAASDFRVFNVAKGATLTLRDFAVAHGRTAELGAGIMNAGTLELRRVTLSDNTAGNGGGVANLVGGTATIWSSALFLNATTGVGGGAVLNSGTLTIKRSLISNNTAPINGGAINTQATGDSMIVSSTFEHNVAGSLGGAISNLGTTTVDHCTISSNTGSGGGAIASSNTDAVARDSRITNNLPDNCSPVNAIPGCVD